MFYLRLPPCSLLIQTPKSSAKTHSLTHLPAIMPRATRSSARTATEAAKPYSKTTAPKELPIAKAEDKPAKVLKAPKPTRKTKDGKDSHLYTDDNPSTTLKGTGFKDAATAEHTIELVAKRSLLYQFQTVKTMYHRANHHPHSDKNADMQAAMKIFRTWLDETYPKLRSEQKEFPLLKKEVVELYLPRIQNQASKLGIDSKWAELYVALPKGKRLANVLMDDSNPAEADLTRVRQDVLEGIVKERGGEMPGKADEALWSDDGAQPSMMHLKCIAYGFSPCKPEIIVKKFASSEKAKGSG